MPRTPDSTPVKIHSFKTPKRRPKPATPDVPNTTTKRRIGRAVNKRVTTNENGSSSDKEEPESSSESDDENPVKPSAAKITQERLATGSYFDAQSGKHITSNHTLDKLDIPRLDREAVFQMIDSQPNLHKKEMNRLVQKYKLEQFSKWKVQLVEGFNLIFHGIGSKFSLLNEFRESMLREEYVLVVNGFFPGLMLNEILTSITFEILGEKQDFRNPNTQLEFIESRLKSDPMDLYLLIHNIDGPMLQNDKVQTALCRLAQLNMVHLIASIDHINSPLLWDQKKVHVLRWIWHDVTTYEMYRYETCHENTLLIQQSSALALSSLLHVFESLTPNGRNIFLLLAKYQINNASDSHYKGMPKQDLYVACREHFFVSSELTLSSQLVEFRDHKLIQVKKGPDGGDCLFIPLDTSALSYFIQNQEGES